MLLALAYAPQWASGRREVTAPPKNIDDWRNYVKTVVTRYNGRVQAAAFLARSYIVTWAAGVQRFYWYAWDNWSLAIVTYKEAERQVTPVGNAYNVIQRWLVGATMVSCAESPDHTWT
jgi:hypothetical protein